LPVYINGINGLPVYLNGINGLPVYLNGINGVPVYLNGINGVPVYIKFNIFLIKIDICINIVINVNAYLFR
jgi:hypothetical protein